MHACRSTLEDPTEVDAEGNEVAPHGPTEDDLSEEHIRVLSNLVKTALAPSDTIVAARAERVRARLAPAELQKIDDAIANDGWLASELVDRSGALVLEAAHQRRISDTKATALLSEAVTKRLRDVPPDGAHWANGGGCGIDVEETPAEKAAREEREKHGQFDAMVSIGCGMGHVPDKASRMLYFYAVEHGGIQI